MARTYSATLTGTELKWRGDAPDTSRPVEVHVTVVDEPASPGPRRPLREIVDDIVRLDPFRDIEDPAAWQREVRKDRPLPFRDE